MVSAGGVSAAPSPARGSLACVSGAVNCWVLEPPNPGHLFLGLSVVCRVSSKCEIHTSNMNVTSDTLSDTCTLQSCNSQACVLTSSLSMGTYIAGLPGLDQVVLSSCGSSAKPLDLVACGSRSTKLQ